MDYAYKTVPYLHQSAILERSVYEPYWALLMEQRTGKSKVSLDTTAILHRDGHINALLILAPNGVHRNWVSDEIPKHLPDWVQRYVAVWTADDTKKKKAELEKLFDPGYHLRVLSMNLEAIGTKRGFEMAKRFLMATDCMVLLDESTRIKNIDAAITQAAMKLRDLAKFRRILNGTPVTEGPLDLYSQLLWLSDDAVPVQSWVAYRNRYAEYAPPDNYLVQKIMKEGLRRAGRYDMLSKLETGEISPDDVRLKRWTPPIQATDSEGRPVYKNLDELQEWLKKCSSRVLRRECADIPEKLYKKWEVEYPAEQQKLVKYYLAAMREGRTPEPINKLTAVMLYQRLLCGMIPKQLTGLEENTPMFNRPEDNPRLQAVLQIAQAYPDATIIYWARFHADLRAISDLLESHKLGSVARYWGEISDGEREQNKLDFQAGKHRFFVGQQGAGGVGLPLHRADMLVYHSNTFSNYHRQQSEDRAENLEKTVGTLVIDLEVPNTVDTKIITALRDKKDVADLITGDDVKEWLV